MNIQRLRLIRILLMSQMAALTWLPVNTSVAQAVIVQDPGANFFPATGSVYERSDTSTTIFPTGGTGTGFDVRKSRFRATYTQPGQYLLTTAPSDTVVSSLDVFSELSIDGGQNTFEIESFFDVTYQIDFQGQSLPAPGKRKWSQCSFPGAHPAYRGFPALRLSSVKLPVNSPWGRIR